MHIEWWHGCIFFQLFFMDIFSVHVYVVKVTILVDAMITMFQKDGKLFMSILHWEMVELYFTCDMNKYQGQAPDYYLWQYIWI